MRGLFASRRKVRTMLNEYGAIRKVAVRRPETAFHDDARIDSEWRDLNYHARPELQEAIGEHQAFVNLLGRNGAEVVFLDDGEGLTLDSLYVRDSLIVCTDGLVKCHMGKPARRKEPGINAGFLGLPIAGEIMPPGKIEGGDVVWLDDSTLLVGVGYRTNMAAVEQLQGILGKAVAVHAFDMPHYKGPGDVFHLMSILSPVDHDLAVVHLPLMPARLVELLQQREIAFVDVPEKEFPTMACNVLAMAPRHVIVVEGNPETVRLMQAAGCMVEVIKAAEISRKGEGGPTCLTRPLVRA